MDSIDVLYGINNPLFLELSKGPADTIVDLMPWLFKYLLTLPKINRLKKPVDEYLAALTQDRALIDMVTQHFSQKTPTYFALSYFSPYLDYRYPKGGTGTLSQKLAEYIIEGNGAIRVGTEIQHLDPAKGILVDKTEKEYSYGKLVWAADSGVLFRSLDMKAASASFSPKTMKAIEARRESLKGKRGADSILSIFFSSTPPIFLEASQACTCFYPFHPRAFSQPNRRYTPKGRNQGRAI